MKRGAEVSNAAAKSERVIFFFFFESIKLLEALKQRTDRDHPK